MRSIQPRRGPIFRAFSPFSEHLKGVMFCSLHYPEYASNKFVVILLNRLAGIAEGAPFAGRASLALGIHGKDSPTAGLSSNEFETELRTLNGRDDMRSVWRSDCQLPLELKSHSSRYEEAPLEGLHRRFVLRG